jgi:hypothetical protein
MPIKQAILQEFLFEADPHIKLFQCCIIVQEAACAGIGKAIKFWKEEAGGSTSPRSVRQTPTGTPCRSLKPAMAFLERVTTAFWPVISAMSRIVDSRVFAF